MDLSPERGELCEWYHSTILHLGSKVKIYHRILFVTIKVYLAVVLLYFVLSNVALLLAKSVRNEHLKEDARSNILNSDAEPVEFEYTASKFTYVWAVIGSLGFFGMAFLAYMLSSENIHRFENLKRKKLIFEISDLSCKELREIVFDLSKLMNIDYTQIKLWSTYNSKLFPSIEQINDSEINLLIPPAFLRFYTKNSEETKAILAHEFGHVLQKDTEIYLILDTYFRVVNLVFVPTILLGILEVCYLFFVSPYSTLLSHNYLLLTLTLLFNVTLLGFLYYGFHAVRSARRRSELFADTASVIFSDGNFLLKVLRNLKGVNSQSEAATHPLVKDRIDNIIRIMTDYNIAFS